MKVTHWTRLATVVIAGTIVSASAQAQQLPNAKDLHAKYVQAIGGPEAIKKHEQMHLTGEHEDRADCGGERRRHEERTGTATADHFRHEHRSEHGLYPESCDQCHEL